MAIFRRISPDSDFDLDCDHGRHEMESVGYQLVNDFIAILNVLLSTLHLTSNIDLIHLHDHRMFIIAIVVDFFCDFGFDLGSVSA